MYGCRMEVAAITELLTLLELLSITRQFEQVDLGKEVKERLMDLLEMREHGSKLVEVVTLLARYKVEELLPLVEEKVKKAQVGEKDLAGLIVMVNDGGPQSKVSFSGQQLGF